jgi:hypothetical protein
MLCKVSGSFEQLAQYLGKYFGNIHNEQWSTTEGQIAVFLGESYFMRSNSNAAALMILKEAGESETHLEIISHAGGSGVLEISGRPRAYVNRIKDTYNEQIRVEVTKEIPNYDVLSADTLKNSNSK